MIDSKTNQEIHRRETDKKEAYHQMEIEQFSDED